MKSSLILLLSLISFSVLAQKLPVTDGKLGGILPLDETGSVSYQVVNQVTGVDKKELFLRARDWFFKRYASPKDVLQVNDPENGELSGRSFFMINPSIMGMAISTKVDYTAMIEIKDGRYRITINSFYVQAKTVSGPIDNLKDTSKGFIKNVYLKTDESVSDLLKSLNIAMSTSKADF